MIFTLVYLRANKFPRESRKIEIDAADAHSALCIFVNMPEHDSDWVACMVEGTMDKIHGTL